MTVNWSSLILQYRFLAGKTDKSFLSLNVSLALEASVLENIFWNLISGVGPRSWLEIKTFQGSNFPERKLARFLRYNRFFVVETLQIKGWNFFPRDLPRTAKIRRWFGMTKRQQFDCLASWTLSLHKRCKRLQLSCSTWLHNCASNICLPHSYSDLYRGQSHQYIG